MMHTIYQHIIRLFRRTLFSGGALGGMYQAAVNLKDFKPIVDPSGAGPLAQAYSDGNLGNFLNTVWKIAFAAAAMSVVLVVVWYGFRYMTAVTEGMKSNAKARLTGAFVGLAMLLGMVIFLEQINPCLLELNVSFTTDTSSDCATR